MSDDTEDVRDSMERYRDEDDIRRAGYAEGLRDAREIAKQSENEQESILELIDQKIKEVEK